MRWGFVVEGQPVSWNSAYRVGMVRRTGRGGRLRLDALGRPVDKRTIVKTDEAKAYVDLVTYRARRAVPRDWSPIGLVVIELYYYLGRDVDCDNVMKLVDDGIQAATGVNDQWFLPRAMSKTTGLRPNERRIEVIVDDGASPSVAPPG